MSLRPSFRFAGDRTAVLFLGLASGFAVGLSFNRGGQDSLAGSLAAGGGGSSGTVAAASAPAAGGAAALVPLVGAPDARVVQRVASTGRIRIGVFGDSFGDGVYDALYRRLPREEGYDVYRFSKEATGFTRYHQLDLEQRALTQVRADPIDVAVISFGLNDVQPIWENKHLQPYLSDEWKGTVGGRVDRFVAAVRSTGAAVAWVGLPVMRDPDTDRGVQQINAFYAARLGPLGVPFVATRAASVDAHGQYTAYVPNARTGAPMLIRTPDGVHMIGMGYQHITEGLIANIRSYAERSRRAAGRPAPTPSSTAAAR
ncbi:GDSL-type esterase/lipase family protein [Sphingomonas sp.]|uniref:SGNH/GDSL hydrolase family protein n=1 Tax=Sphingomonas sp. TaxID=28214 RepID=UPI003CC54D96